MGQGHTPRGRSWDEPVCHILSEADPGAKLAALSHEKKDLKEIPPLQGKLFAKRQKLRLLFAKPNPDAAHIMAKQKESAELQAQLPEMRTKHRLEARMILTPEQQQELVGGLGPGFTGGWCSGPMRRGS